jgi:hypothetical protein
MGASRPHNISLPAHYDRIVHARMTERGISRSEAVRQFIDEASGRSNFRSVAIRTQVEAAKQIITHLIPAPSIPDRRAEVIALLCKISELA